MRTKEYIEQAVRTKSHLYLGNDLNQDNIDLIHGAMGLVTESGEFLDALKKTLFYAKPLDKTNLEEEVGDVMWYIAIICNSQHWDLEKIMQKNIQKLKARYPEKFTEEKANNRDLETERKILEESI